MAMGLVLVLEKIHPKYISVRSCPVLFEYT